MRLILFKARFIIERSKDSLFFAKNNTKIVFKIASQKKSSIGEKVYDVSYAKIRSLKLGKFE